jgi:hypothetical protein
MVLTQQASERNFVSDYFVGGGVQTYKAVYFYYTLAMYSLLYGNVYVSKC